MIGRRSRAGWVVAVLAAVWICVGPAATAAGAARGEAAPHAVANPDLLRNLNSTEQAALTREGFVVTAPPLVHNVDQGTEYNNTDQYHQAYWQFYDLYGDNYLQNVPNFVTSDAVLHTFHIIYDNMLKLMERSVFVSKLQQLNSGLMDATTYQYGATTDPALKEAARLNLGYVAVAQRLLNPAAPVPALVAPQVNQELALINAHQGFAQSPLFGYQIDYSQFIPRGHYTSSPVLRHYFQAMEWYGQLTFHLNTPDAALRTRQALLLVRGLTLIPRLGALWAAVFDPITAWVGPSDDLTVRDYAALMARVYPAKAPVSALSDAARLARFIALAKALPGPRINSELATSSAQAANKAKGMRLFGQRFIPDAAVMEALIWDKVGTAQRPRIWPMGLDVAASLGSQKATALLTGPLGQQRYAHYTSQLASLQRDYQALPATAWVQNLYWGWLNTLRAVWAPAPSAAPAFMRTTAWATKAVGTGLGSWAELRHDTLLYAKQPAGLGGGGAPQPHPTVAYVEPVPIVYARLAALTLQLKATLLQEGFLDTLPHTYGFSAADDPGFLPALPKGEQGYRAALDAFATLLALLQRVSSEELAGQAVSQADMQALIQVGNSLGALTEFFQDSTVTTPQLPVDKQVAAIADVFTAPSVNQVLEVGVGDVLPIYVVVTINGRTWLTRGGVFSYYEFHQPMSDRLTDDAWRTMTHRPAQPSWTAAYVTR